MEEKKKDIKPVSQANVKKKSAGKKFIDEFIQDDLKDIGEYILWDVIVPTSKNAISELVSGGIDMLLFGKDGRSTRRGGRPAGGRNYSSISSSKSNGVRIVSYNDREEKKHNVTVPRNIGNYDDLYFETRPKAEDALDELRSILREYENVSVADYFTVCKCEELSEFTDERYGWTSLDGVCVYMNAPGDFRINLPRPRAL